MLRGLCVDCRSQRKVSILKGSIVICHESYYDVCDEKMNYTACIDVVIYTVEYNVLTAVLTGGAGLISTIIVTQDFYSMIDLVQVEFRRAHARPSQSRIAERRFACIYP